MKKEDVVAGMLAYIAHLREVGALFHGEELSGRFTLVQVFLRDGGNPLCLYRQREALALSGMAVEAGLYAQYGVHLYAANPAYL